MKRIYLAHPLGAPTREGIEANRRSAARWAAASEHGKHARTRLHALVDSEPGLRLSLLGDWLEKLCSNCRKWTDLDNFERSNAQPDGHENRCKPCRNARRRELKARRAS